VKHLYEKIALDTDPQRESKLAETLSRTAGRRVADRRYWTRV